MFVLFPENLINKKLLFAKSQIFFLKKISVSEYLSCFVETSTSVLFAYQINIIPIPFLLFLLGALEWSVLLTLQ